jgi:signal transduction histidine kinase
LFYFKYLYFKSQQILQNTLAEVSIASEMNEIFMFSLAHDLRSPLNNVNSLVKLLKKHKGYSEDELKWLDMIELSATNSNALVDQILESNELMKNKLHLESYDLNILVEGVVNTSRLKAETKSIKIYFQKVEPTCIAYFDPLKIDRLLTNLLNNAIKFSYPSGNILIKVAKLKNAAIISILDHGIGISEENATKIFDPFTKAKRKGTENEVSFGLGLSICKQIIELHGGNIKVISELGKGAEFIVSLPLSS